MITYLRTSKLDQLLIAMEKEDYIKAISIASKFYDLGKHKDQIKKAQDALLVPDFYKQIGKDPKQLVNDGIQAIRERYNLKGVTK